MFCEISVKTLIESIPDETKILAIKNSRCFLYKKLKLIHPATPTANKNAAIGCNRHGNCILLIIVFSK